MIHDAVISNFIEQQFPQLYREEGMFLVEFVKQYYIWMERTLDAPVYHARHFLPNRDIDTTVDSFLVFFKEKYLKNIQLNTATNTKRLIKNSIDLYRSKGTENSIKLFFDLIFSTPAEVYYPGNDVFRLSSAEWYIPKYIEIQSKPVNRLMVGQSIYGVQSGASAYVEKLVRRKIKGIHLEVFYISAITGEFQTGEIIRLLNDNSHSYTDYPKMVGSLTNLEVVDGSHGFSKGEVVSLKSKTGAQGRAIVEDIKDVGGIVDFNLLDGGWGYTANSTIHVSDEILQLVNVSITSTGNTPLVSHRKIIQPLANVQWYDNTAPFNVGDTVYNYYANGDLIGVNKIISAEYGDSNTTNYFLLNLLSGNNEIDVTAQQYFTSGNTASFLVQNAGWLDLTATGTVTGMSSNVYIYCSGNSNHFSVGSRAYQISTNNQIYATAQVEEIDQLGSGSFVLRVVNLDGLYLTNQKLRTSLSNTGNVTITSLSYDLGLHDVSNNIFRSYPGNLIYDLANGSQFYATVNSVPFGDGASVHFDPDLINPEVISVNINFVNNHLDESLQRNWINAVSYGAELNNANLTNMPLDEALSFDSMTLGTIARLTEENPGSNYSYSPFAHAVDPFIAPLKKMDFVVKIANTTGVYSVGEQVNQAVEGAVGLVKFANTSVLKIRRMTFGDKWKVGSSNTHLIVGQKTGVTSTVLEVTSDTSGIAGENALIETTVFSSDSSVSSLKVTSSGFNFNHGDSVTYTSLDNLRAGRAVAGVITHGIASGYYRTTSGFLSHNKYIYDGDYFQDFSYEIRSPITISRYRDMLKSVLHVAGTKSFSGILKGSVINSMSSVKSSTVSQANT